MFENVVIKSRHLGFICNPHEKCECVIISGRPASRSADCPSVAKTLMLQFSQTL